MHRETDPNEGVLNHPDFPKTDFSFVKGCLSGAAPLAVETLSEEG